jgi:hypothetical protein
MKTRVKMVGAKGFEPSTSWSRISSRNTILLARLALFCVEHADMDPYSAAIGLKSDSTIWKRKNACHAQPPMAECFVVDRNSAADVCTASVRDRMRVRRC